MKKILAVIFDFDDTLAHDSTTDFLHSLGVDTQQFWAVGNKTLVNQGWDPVPAYMYQMVEWSKRQAPANRITQTRLQEFGQQVRFFAGAQRFFPVMTEFVKSRDPDVSLEFYIISSGLGDLIRHSKIAKFMTDIFASDFAYAADGAITYPKKLISFTDKTRYLFQISKGLVGPAYRNNPYEVNTKVESSDLRIPFKQMIYIGDGLTDIPCFSLMKQNEGTAFAVYDKENTEKRPRAWGFIEQKRVDSLHSANYSKNSDLLTNIELALDTIIRRP